MNILWLTLLGSAAATISPMVEIPAGSFQMGCTGDCPMEDAKPAHGVEMDAFLMDETPVTNAQFAVFVRETGYLTFAARTPSSADYPTVPADQLVAGSAVFSPQDVSLINPYAWWRFAPGASWRRPDGPGAADSATTKPEHPVVHVAYEDALAYCKWAKKDLPTEAQYEYAARGGLVGKRYAWGDELRPGGKWMANIWQGRFPKDDGGEDGYRGPSPVRAFPKNGYGLYDIAGNVWHWCKDWYRPDTYAQRLATKAAIRNPEGPSSSDDPSEPGVAKRVQRGGSYLCSDQYCIRYLVGSRGRGSVDSSTSNLGFRCVAREDRTTYETTVPATAPDLTAAPWHARTRASWGKRRAPSAERRAPSAERAATRRARRRQDGKSCAPAAFKNRGPKIRSSKPRILGKKTLQLLPSGRSRDYP
jgi:formylglycine-generating enzyme required for sulfatase activity